MEGEYVTKHGAMVQVAEVGEKRYDVLYTSREGVETLRMGLPASTVRDISQLQKWSRRSNHVQ